MNKQLKTHLLIVFALFIGLFPMPLTAQLVSAAPINMAKTELEVLTKSKIIKLTIEIAVSPEEQEYGLMNRKKIPKNTGMLFVMPEEKKIEMWMKDTLIPLDMLFINRHGKIVHIQESTTPNSLEVISTETPALAVLELAGGEAKTLNVAVGDTIQGKYFQR